MNIKVGDVPVYGEQKIDALRKWDLKSIKVFYGHRQQGRAPLKTFNWNLNLKEEKGKKARKLWSTLT